MSKRARFVVRRSESKTWDVVDTETNKTVIAGVDTRANAREQAAAVGRNVPSDVKNVNVVRNMDELKAIVGEESAKEILGRIKNMVLGDGSRVQCRVVIDFEAPSEILAQGACNFLRHVVKETIESSNWGKGSFQSQVMVPDKPESKADENEKPGEPKPVSPLN